MNIEINEIFQKICSLYPSALDEDIPDDDKEAAYNKGYNDATEDIVDLLKKHFNCKQNIKAMDLSWEIYNKTGTRTFKQALKEAWEVIKSEEKK